MFGFYKKAYSESQYMVGVMLKREEELIKKLEEANKKLYEYMDITRKEALEIYQKGLHDGINIQLSNMPPAASNSPVIRVEEYKEQVIESKKVNKENEKLNKALQNVLNFDGSKQEEIEDE